MSTQNVNLRRWQLQVATAARHFVTRMARAGSVLSMCVRFFQRVPFTLESEHFALKMLAQSTGKRRERKLIGWRCRSTTLP